jgi:hypothetical protein
MGALDPVEPTFDFAADAAPTSKVNAAQLDAQLALLAAATNAHSTLLQDLVRSDLSLRDGLIRGRMLHEEVAGLFQVIVQATENGLQVLPACAAATTANIDLTGEQTIDGYDATTGDRILVKEQDEPAENGIYVCDAAEWFRAEDAETWDDLQSAMVWVENGSACSLTAWSSAALTGGTVDIDPVQWTLIYRAAMSLASVDGTAVPAVTLDETLDSILIVDAATGKVRRVPFADLPYIITLAHNELTGLSADDHPQYLRKVGGIMTGPIDMGAQKVVNADTPTDPGDLCTKAYVDSMLAAASLAGAPPGACMDFAGLSPPAGWLERDGSAVSRTTYATLFAVCSTTYGAGDGVTTFNLPDDRGRVDVGAGSGPGLTTRVVGQTGGEEKHALTGAENGPHTHSFVVNTNSSGGDGHPVTDGNDHGTSSLTASSGSGTPHNVMQPFGVKLKIIKY